jgi:hypothetical protein
VAGINPSANLLTVEKSSGEQRTYRPRRLTGVSAYRGIDRAFSVGDRIQYTAPDKSLGVANQNLPPLSLSRWTAAFQPVLITVKSISTPTTTAILTMATPSLATAPRASPPSASS